MKRKLPVRISEKMIQKIYVESDSRDGSYIMPTFHCHPYHELYYVESGACRFLIEDNLYDLHAGDFLMIPPNVLHYTRYLFGPCRRSNLFFLESDIEPQVKALYPAQERFFSEVRIFQVPQARQEQMHQLIGRMLREERIGDDISVSMLHMMLQEMYLFCARECSFPEEAPANIHTTDLQIVSAARFICQHYMEQITAVDISNASGFSPNYLSRKFREAAGIGVHQYLMFIRLQHAANELVSTTDPVTEIAFRCGFSNSNYFKDAFKKAYGFSPRTYRKQAEEVSVISLKDQRPNASEREIQET